MVRERWERLTEEPSDEAMERELLGVIKRRKKPEGKPESKDQAGLEYLSFEEAIKEVKEEKLSDPLNPDQPFADKLRVSIAEDFDLEDDSDLKYYTATTRAGEEMSLKEHHGVDAFFELDTQSGGLARVTLDITTNPRKRNPKADLLILLPEDFPFHAYFKGRKIEGLTESEWELFQKTVEDITKEIVDKLEEKM